MSATKIKLVFYKGKVRVFLGRREIPLSRLPDLIPIYLDKVNPDAGGAVVLEGYAWYGEGSEDEVIGDEYLVPYLESEMYEDKNRNGNETDDRRIESYTREVASSDGNFRLRFVRGDKTRLVVIFRFEGKEYRTVFVSSLNKLDKVLSPELLLVRMGIPLSRFDVRDLVRSYLMEDRIKEFIRYISESETRNQDKR